MSKLKDCWGSLFKHHSVGFCTQANCPIWRGPSLLQDLGRTTFCGCHMTVYGMILWHNATQNVSWDDIAVEFNVVPGLSFQHSLMNRQTQSIQIWAHSKFPSHRRVVGKFADWSNVHFFGNTKTLFPCVWVHKHNSFFTMYPNPKVDPKTWKTNKSCEHRVQKKNLSWFFLFSLKNSVTCWVSSKFQKDPYTTINDYITSRLITLT